MSAISGEIVNVRESECSKKAAKNIEKIPSNIVARLFRFKKAEFFEIQDTQERKVPKSY